MTNLPGIPLIDYGPSVIAGAVAVVGGIWTVALKFGWLDGGGWAGRRRESRRRRHSMLRLGRTRDHLPDEVSGVDRIKMVASAGRSGVWEVDVWGVFRNPDAVPEIMSLWEGNVGPLDDTDPTMVALLVLQEIANDLSQDPLF